MLARPTIALVLLTLVAIPLGCARNHSQITPTTTGTDLRNIPRGRMTPLPFPGSSLARVPKTDPATVTVKTAEDDPIR